MADDPNRMLTELRSLSEELSEHDDDDVVRFAELFHKFEEHILDGGDLPDEWEDADDDDEDDEDEDDLEAEPA